MFIVQAPAIMSLNNRFMSLLQFPIIPPIYLVHLFAIRTCVCPVLIVSHARREIRFYGH